MSTSFPSFMSVYGSDDLAEDKDLSHEHISQVPQKDNLVSLGQINANPSFQPTHNLPFAIHHRGSVNSLTSVSSESSPTTTHSTFDSPLVAESSPSSSPESATSKLPLTPFQTAMQSSDDERAQAREQTRLQPHAHSSSYPRSESPTNSKNVKGLSLNMNTTLLARPATSAGLESSHTFSAPTSPLKEAMRAGKRKPTNLTIRTPGFQQLTFARTTPEVPPTPSSRPSLLHFQSSPSLLSLTTPTTSSSTGLHLTLPPFINGHSRPGSDSSFSSQSMNGALPGLREEEECFQPHISQEIQERGYPDGPVLIYDCGVYLYLEPTREEASKFDVVINVAKEIKNPFESQAEQNKTIVSIWRGEHERNHVAEPQTAISEISFKSAWEFQPLDAPTPTARNPPSSWEKEPEYIHVHWDHNSEILHDLFPLCKIIDDRINQGKKVLIHCQLGVSRSASLVIAYGLFKGYQPNFHSMYMQVKDRSQWVGPNMSLIYQLTDFRSKVARGDYNNGGPMAPPSWFQNRTVSSTVLKTPDVSSLTLNTNDSQTIVRQIIAPKQPQTARKLSPLRLDKELPPIPSFPQFTHLSASHTDTRTEVHADISSVVKPDHAVEGFQPQPVKTSTQANQAINRPLPFRERADYEKSVSTPPNEESDLSMIDKSSAQSVPPPKMDLANQDVPSTPSLFSPRATEFLASPFGLNAAGDLAVPRSGSLGSLKSIPPPESPPSSLSKATEENAIKLPTEKDPRSPHQQGEAGEILRHIDDVL